MGAGGVMRPRRNFRGRIHSCCFWDGYTETLMGKDWNATHVS